MLEGGYGDLNDELAEVLRRVRTNSCGLLDLITAVLDLSRLEAGRIPLQPRRIEMGPFLAQLGVESEPGRGSTFRVWVPAAP